MTLILTARSTYFAVITADGRCMEKPRGVPKTTSNTLQKIFPLMSKGFAIAHHGENIIDGRPVKDMAEEFLINKTSVIGQKSVEDIARLFVQGYGTNIENTLTAVPDRKFCGFLFVGFGGGEKAPQIWEATWKKGGAANIAHKIEARGYLVRSGEAAEHIDQYLNGRKESQFLKDNILYWGVYEARGYCDKLYSIAEKAEAKAGKDRFGGHKHQLEVKKKGCNWLVPPPLRSQ